MIFMRITSSSEPVRAGESDYTEGLCRRQTQARGVHLGRSVGHRWEAPDDQVPHSAARSAAGVGGGRKGLFPRRGARLRVRAVLLWTDPGLWQPDWGTR